MAKTSNTAHKSSKQSTFVKAPSDALSFAKASDDKKAMAGRQGKLPTMQELLQSTGYKIPTLRRGQEVTGKVISVSRQEILIDIGAKSEGIVFGREFTSVKDLVSNLSAGDQVDAIVIYSENEAGQVVLSLRKLSGEKRWSELEGKKADGQSIDVVAQEVNRGGIICDWLGLRGFLPASQLSQPPADMNALIGKTLKVKVIEIDKTTNRLIFSQKQPDEKSLKNLQKLLTKVQIGQKFAGVVSAVLPFGLFVEIEVGREPKSQRAKEPKDSVSSGSSVTSDSSKLEGLVHISEISWEKVEDPAKMFKVGDKVDVAVIAKEESTARLNLSIKQLAADPFLEVSKKYSKDQAITGAVERVTPYGVFVTLENGVDGMIHVSKIPPNESWEIGKSVDCTIESIDTAARKISLIPVSKEKPILYR